MFILYVIAFVKSESDRACVFFREKKTFMNQTAKHEKEPIS